MGAFFQLEHANIVAYMTSRSGSAPRVRRDDLDQFLSAISGGARDSLISEFGDGDDWRRDIAHRARRARDSLESPFGIGLGREWLSGHVVSRVLEELRSDFSDYALYALAVGTGSELRGIARDFAERPLHGQLLVLIPNQAPTERNFEVLDPIPAFSTALHAISRWPGFLFWTPNGASAFAPLDTAHELMDKLERGQFDGRRYRRPFPLFGTSGFDNALREWVDQEPPTPTRRLLHLSDLHFGTRSAIQNQALLDAELHDVVKTVDRVVITGDLFDTPKKDCATLFQNFRNSITRLAKGRPPIAITGNHDLRTIGLLGKNYEHIASIGTTKVVVDDDCEMIFICFNSSEKGSLARGKIPASQFASLGGEYRNLLSANQKLKSYLPIVLVHHHPFSFDVPPETWVQRALAAFGIGDEVTLQMVNAEDLHHWCMDWKINTILHGHKHKARYLQEHVSRDAETMKLTAIGCGSSLGAEGTPMSYNLLEWDASREQWVASFWESINGGAFRELVTSVSPEGVLPKQG